MWERGQRLALGGPRQLTLFAVLVLHANRAVSRDALIDAVWEPRPGADNRLQMAVARLRKTLEGLDGDAGSRVQTVGGGYLLSIAPGELDADGFHAGVHAGTRALEAGDFAKAAGLLHEALALWRGPPLAEVAFEDFAQANPAPGGAATARARVPHRRRAAAGTARRADRRARGPPGGGASA